MSYDDIHSEYDPTSRLFNPPLRIPSGVTNLQAVCTLTRYNHDVNVTGLERGHSITLAPRAYRVPRAQGKD